MEVKHWDVKYEAGNTSFDTVCEGHRFENIAECLTFYLDPEEGDPIITAQFAPGKWSMVKCAVD